MKNNSFVQPKPSGMNFSGGQTDGFASGIAERIGRSVAYMAKHVDRPLQVSALAAQANVSPSHYFTLFKRQMGTPPIDFFIRLRMDRARQLLDSTSWSIKEISARLGYQDAFYFSRVFKSVHRVAPTEYRRQNGKLKTAATSSNGRAVEPLLIFDSTPQNRISFQRNNQNNLCQIR